MSELFFLGDRLFMGIITIVAVLMFVLSFINIRVILTRQVGDGIYRNISRVKELGLLALIIGILASTIDMIAAFDAIKAAGDVSMSLMAAGLKLTLIAPVYGLIIYSLSLLIAIGLHWKVTKLGAEVS